MGLQRWFCADDGALRHGCSTPVLEAFLRRAPNARAHLPIGNEAPRDGPGLP